MAQTPWHARLVWLTLLMAAPTWALTVTQEECREGAEFIRNAALSRTHGMTRTAFLTQLEDDLTALQSLPEAVRWFVRDDEDAALLTRASTAVFDHARPASDHEAEFLADCQAAVALAIARATPHADAR